MKHIRTDVTDDAPYGDEQDACALYFSARKQGQSTFGTLKRALKAVGNMGHRTGFVNGEGDGAGVQTDIPRQVWAKRLSKVGLRASMVTHPGFWVGHLFVQHGTPYSDLRDRICSAFAEEDVTLLVDMPGVVRPEVLGGTGRINPSAFWQIAGLSEAPDVDQRLFRVHVALEAALPVHFASLGSNSVVYKMRGSAEALARYYPDLQDRDFDTSMVMCHARYSTNTVSSFERAQPFALLGHNGEINTISRFRQEAEQIQAHLPAGGSDSQDLDRALHTLCVQYGLDLMEAMEVVFPPVPYEVDLLPPQLRAIYTSLRHMFGPYAQGPAAIAARYGDFAVFSVDALGLRPLWFSETEKEYVFSSERGAIPLENMVRDPRPLSPGEKMALKVVRGVGVEVFSHTQVRHHVMSRAAERDGRHVHPVDWPDWRVDSLPETDPDAPRMGAKTSVARQPMLTVVNAAAPRELSVIVPHLDRLLWQASPELTTAQLAAMGWSREHAQEIESIVETGKDPVGSLGYDGPLAVLSKNRVNLADYFKETVAVVTNPSIDRGREGEAFSTSVLIGARPDIAGTPRIDDILVECAVPLLAGGHGSLGTQEAAQEVARQLGTLTLEELVAVFEGRFDVLMLGVMDGESVEQALERLESQAVDSVRRGAQCILLDDAEALHTGAGWLDPHLATACVDQALRRAESDRNLRRRIGLVVRSASIRTLHDLALLCGFGADAINPYAMLSVAVQTVKDPSEDQLIQVQVGLLETLRSGVEKVISTMGCHELRGYGRVCSAIGLAPSLAARLRTANHFGSENVGLTWECLNAEAAERGAELRGPGKPRLAHVDRFYPKFWKKVEDYATGEIVYEDLRHHYQKLAAEVPVALRHVLGIRKTADHIDPTQVDLCINGYDLPVAIGAMSFGSQGELSYRAYAQAAAELNIICINGEGGELPELMGRFKRNRGQQVASGRFGVNAEFLNSAAVIEIKIGQGAKPGEGGMLPGYKVTPQVASARRTTPFVPLLSPSNNHDLYSIEDLAQLIEELRTVNPEARISVKCPVVPNIGLIAVGVAKAGADIINLTGFDGATGAARRHALQYVGLPTEIGIVQAHRALTDAGIRHKVELWCDGGMKTGEDAVKMILLGANRVGFATMAMVAIGCTICRKCDEGTCHVGITTHIRTEQEAQEKGLKSFVPRDYQDSVERIVRLFDGIAGEMRELTAQLGARRLQDLVGRADLLEQVRWQDRVDVSAMFEAIPVCGDSECAPGVGRLLTRPRNNLTRYIGESVLAALVDGEREVTYQDEAMAFDRALGAHLAGGLMRERALYEEVDRVHLHFGPSSVAGNGFAAWVCDRMDVLIEGGAQDGVAKGASGGRVAVMKGLNHDGLRIDGSVGKSFAYGAQKGVLIVQGNADSRACIRLSGADVILGGEITEPLDDSAGSIGARANLKGFACEYMTAGRVVILGDPGPYAFAGMVGGIVYQLLTPEMGMDLDALDRRLAQGADVCILPLEPSDLDQVRELLGHYVETLHRTDQHSAAQRIQVLTSEDSLAARFVKVVPLAIRSKNGSHPAGNAR